MKNLKLTLHTNKLWLMKWYIGALYAINENCKGHGSYDHIWGGGNHNILIKTKHNFQTWTLYFMEAKGYDIEDNIIHQDNESRITLKYLES